jgi:hypothetical protein
MNIDQIRTDVAKVKEIEKGVTDGPWEYIKYNSGGNYGIWTLGDDGERINSDTDGVFVAESRTLLPALAAACDELMREIEVRDLALQYACDSGEDWSQATLDTLSKGAVNQARRDIAEEAEKKTND